MTEPTTETTAAAHTATDVPPHSFVLEKDVTLGDQVIHKAGTRITVREPEGGALRGLQLLSIQQLDVVQLETLAPRITSPLIPKGAAIKTVDLLQFGVEVLDFLYPSDVKAAFLPQ